MRTARLVAVAALCLASAACVISEQDGDTGHQLPGYGSGYSAPVDVVFHFHSTANMTIVAGRSLALVIVGIWFMRAAGKPVGWLIGIPMLIVAAWLAFDGLRTLASYRIEVRVNDGMMVHIPPAARREISYDSIKTVDIEGYTYPRVAMRGMEGKKDPFMAGPPDWRKMTITLVDGETLVVDVERLSIEQRSNFFNALGKYGHLTPQK